MPDTAAIDLHTHSSVSDGTDSPAALMRAAATAGLTAVALTDHDTSAGIDEAAVAARAAGITLVPGMELSTRLGMASIHLLAYLFDRDNAELAAETAKIRLSRIGRAERMVARIAKDFPLTWDDVLAQTRPGATIGRPHIADALVAAGHVRDRGAAFAEVLHPRAGYFESLYAPSPRRGIQLIKAAGGVPVLAHPAATMRVELMPREELAKLVDAGLFGLEIEHPENHEPGKTRLYELAEEFGLEVTGSSDYHGTGKVNRLGECTTSPDVFAKIVAEATGDRPVWAK